MRRRLNSYAKMRTVERGVTIFQKGDPGTSLFAVFRGTVQMTALSTSGKNAVFNLIREGEIFGEIALLDGKPRTADAVSVHRLHADGGSNGGISFRCCASHPDMAIKLLELALLASAKDDRAGRGPAVSRPEEPVGEDPAAPVAGGAERGDRRISQDDLSHIVGMSREMINKQLQVWAKDQWISLARKRIIVLQPDALARIVAD